VRVRRDRIALDGSVKRISRLQEILRCKPMHQLNAPQSDGVRVELVEIRDARALQLERAHERRHAVDHFAREFPLHGEHIAELALKALAPHDAPIARVDEFSNDQRAWIVGLHAARNDVLHAEQLPDTAHAERCPTERHG